MHDLLTRIPAWRADCEQNKQETIDAVKATAHEQVPYNVQGVSTSHVAGPVCTDRFSLVLGRVQSFLGDGSSHAPERSRQASGGQEKP